MWLAKIPLHKSSIEPRIDIDRYILKYDKLVEVNALLPKEIVTRYRFQDEWLLSSRYNNIKSIEELKIRLDIEGRHLLDWNENPWYERSMR